MFNKIKQYLQYRKNLKIAKMEIAKIAATTLPVITEISKEKANSVKFFHKLVNETKNMDGEVLIKTVLDTISTSLQTNNERLFEILSYIANLEPQDIQKILVHGIIETNKEKEVQ